jgi:hypothetical protein
MCEKEHNLEAQTEGGSFFEDQVGIGNLTI